MADDGTLPFTPEVFELIRGGCRSSAAAVVPYLADLFEPERVIDFGSGEGWWVHEFHRCGSSYCVGVDREQPETVAPGVEHRVVDLSGPLLGTSAAIVGAYESYDLALCLEVAEHLTAEHSDELVDALCLLAPIVVFSAAIPGQGGHGHVNEQWPDYWAAKFTRNGYEVSGALRWKFWGDDTVEPWYQQNLLVAMNRRKVKGEMAASYGYNEMFGEHAFDTPFAVVHPRIFGPR